MGLSLPKFNLIFFKKCLDKWVHFMARCMKMERRGNNWNLKNVRKRDIQILKRLGFESKMMVPDSN